MPWCDLSLETLPAVRLYAGQAGGNRPLSEPRWNRATLTLMMTRIGSLLLLLGLASGLIWAARQSSGPVDATWARTHDKTLRQLLRLRPDVRLDFKAARRDPQEPEYYLAQFDAVQGI